MHGGGLSLFEEKGEGMDGVGEGKKGEWQRRKLIGLGN